MGQTGGAIRVLHVDDEPAFADVAATFLEREADRFVVETATGAEEALDRLAEGEIDCVVSDYDMPDRNGIEFLQAVREDHPDLPFILYTGKGSEEIASDAISAGVTDYLQKEGGTGQYAVLANRIRNAVDQYRSRRALEASQRRLSMFFEQSPLGVIEWDEAFEVVRANDAAREILGYGEGELAGRSWETIVPEPDRDAVAGVVDDLLGDEGGYHSVNENVRKDGERITCEWHNRVVTDDDEVAAIFSQFRDVTEREERERELRAREERFRKLAETANDAIVTIDADSTVRFANPAIERIFGYPPAELEGEPLTRLMPERYRERHREAVDRYLETGDPGLDWTDVEFAGLHRDGHEIELSISFAEFERGDERRFTGIIRDVTEQRRRQATLEERERVLRETYEIIAGREASFAGKVEALLELGRAEIDVAYGTLSAIRGEDYVFEIVAADDDSIEAGDVVPVSATNCEIVASTEETLVLGDVARDAPEQTDRAGYAEWGIACYLGAPVLVDDEVYGTFCFYDTEPRDGFSEWEVTLVDLMSRWAGYELERRQQNERLRRQNERLERFAGIVSHDLRNPLNVARGELELARENPEHLDAVERAHDRMEALIDDLLVLARAGDDIEEVEAVDLAALLERCWEGVGAGAATLRIETDRTVEADEPRLRQLLENLLRNAVEHGGEDVTVTVGDLEDGFYVADDGPGIPPDDREAVFESGYSTTDDGTGFGLNIVEAIADAHGWTVTITDGADGGARFEITGIEGG